MRHALEQTAESQKPSTSAGHPTSAVETNRLMSFSKTDAVLVIHKVVCLQGVGHAACFGTESGIANAIQSSATENRKLPAPPAYTHQPNSILRIYSTTRPIAIRMLLASLLSAHPNHCPTTPNSQIPHLFLCPLLRSADPILPLPPKQPKP